MLRAHDQYDFRGVCSSIIALKLGMALALYCPVPCAQALKSRWMLASDQQQANPSEAKTWCLL